MSKWCFNYESGDYENIERDGFSIDRGEYVYNWDDSEYRREEEEQQTTTGKYLFFVLCSKVFYSFKQL